MTIPSNADRFFQEIITDKNPVEFIRSLKKEADPSFESEWFDCKQRPTSEAKVRSMWCEAIGGFANSGGGVLIWGLVAKKDTNDIDRVIREEPISDPIQFKSRLTELARQATNPPVSGIQIDAFTTPEDTTKGFVVCLIPEGQFKPYRSEIREHPQWYIRAGDQFVIASPSLLRVLFYPRLSTAYHIEVSLSWERRIPDANWKFEAQARIRNTGSASGRELFALVDTGLKSPPKFQADGNEWFTDTGVCDAQVSFHATRPLHPKQSRVLFRQHWTRSMTDIEQVGHQPLTFDFCVYSNDQPAQLFRVAFMPSSVNGFEGSKTEVAQLRDERDA